MTSPSNIPTQARSIATRARLLASAVDALVADGYGNSRIVVYDADTGKVKRTWGAYGNTPQATTRANELNRRPTMPPKNATGTKIATRHTTAPSQPPGQTCMDAPRNAANVNSGPGDTLDPNYLAVVESLRAAGGRPDDALLFAQSGRDPKTWSLLPRAMARGDAGALSGLTPAQAVDALQKLCHDLLAVQPFNHFLGLPMTFPAQMAADGGLRWANAGDYRRALQYHLAFCQALDNAVARFRQGMARGVVEPRLTVRNMIAIAVE